MIFFLAMSILFFTLGHWQLLSKRLLEVDSISLRELILPLPQRGKWLAVCCAIVASFFAWIAWLLLIDVNSPELSSRNAIKINVLTAALLPSYILWLWRGVQKRENGVYGFSGPKSSVFDKALAVVVVVWVFI